MLNACFHYSDCNVVVLVTDKLIGSVSGQRGVLKERGALLIVLGVDSSADSDKPQGEQSS